MTEEERAGPGSTVPDAAPAPRPAGYPPGPGYWPAAVAPPGPAPGLQWAGMAVRLGAILIDAVIIAGTEIALSLAISAGSNSSGAEPSSGATLIVLIWLLFALAYHPAGWYFFGSTPGQKALGLRVVRAFDGLNPGIDAVLVRYLIFFLATVVFPIGIISGIVAATEPRKQAWQDDIADTVMVRRV